MMTMTEHSTNNDLRDRLLTPRQAGKLLKMPHQTVIIRIREGRLDGRWIEQRNRWGIPVQAVEDFRGYPVTDQELREALAGRKKTKENFAVTVEIGIVEALRERARKRQRPFSWIVEEALMMYLRRKDKEGVEEEEGG
jgi:hypothetical protein